MKHQIWPLVSIFFVFIFIYSSLTSNNPILLKNIKDDLIMDDKQENVFHFVQCSDIHFAHNKPERKTSFISLLNLLRDVIKPEFVLSTGDFVDSMYFLWLVKQNEVEFKDYRESLRIFNETFNKGNWFDIRGNHDNFGSSEHIDSPHNLFNKYSFNGNDFVNKRVFSFEHRKTFGSYKFIGYDASIRQPTPLHPHNFFGKFETDGLDNLEQELQRSKGYNYTITYSHYPTSIIYSKYSSTKKDLYTLKKEYKVLTHLSGHLHNGYGTLPYLKANFENAHLELEVQDFKSNNKYRILSFDHDIFSFVDLRYDQLPAILVTNPKDCRYLSNYEPLHRMIQSTHIRMFVFSKTQNVDIEVLIDDKKLNNPIIKGENNFYSIKWNPSDYQVGIHKIKVIANDTTSKNFIEYDFSLDGSIPSLNFQEFIGYAALYYYWSSFIQPIFLIIYCSILLSLIIGKAWYIYNTKTKKGSFDFTKMNFITRRILLFLSWDIVLVPYFLFLLSISLHLWEIYLFGIFELVHTYIPVLLFFIFISEFDKNSKIQIIVNIIFTLFIILRIFDCIWHLSHYSFEQILWPPSGLEFWIFTLIVIISREIWMRRKKSEYQPLN